MKDKIDLKVMTDRELEDFYEEVTRNLSRDQKDAVERLNTHSMKDSPKMKTARAVYVEISSRNNVPVHIQV